MTATKRQFWTTGEEARLRALYPDTPMVALRSILQRTESAIYTRAKVLGLKRSDAFLTGEHSGRLHAGSPQGVATRFKRKAMSE